MKYASLIWAGLWRKPLRTSFTILSLMMAFLLFGLLQTVNTGLDHLIETARDDRLIIQPRFGALPFPIAYQTQVASLPGVSSVGVQSFLVGYVGDPKNRFFTGAVDANFLDQLTEIPITPAQRAALNGTPNGIVMSTIMARNLGLKVGDRVPVVSPTRKSDGKNDWVFEVVAITDRPANPGIDQFSFTNYKYLNEERATDKDKVNSLAAIIGDPKKGTEIAKAIDSLFENSGMSTRTVVERLGMTAAVGNLGNVGFFVTAILCGVMFVLLLLTGTTMIQSVNERTTDFGVLKTLGFSNGHVLSFIFAESIIQCLIGAALGFIAAWRVSPMMQGRIPGPPVFFEIPWFIVAVGLVLAILVALLSGALPASRIARLQIVDALRGK